MRVTLKSAVVSVRPLLATAALVLAIGPACALSPRPLSQDDVAWLRRDGFDLDSATVARYRDLGRSRFLDQQLDDKTGDALPPAIASLINSYEVVNTPTEQRLATLRDEQEKIKAMSDGDDKTAAKKAQQEHANLLLQEAQQIQLLHAVYGPNQLKEQMVCSGSIISAYTAPRAACAGWRRIMRKMPSDRTRWASSATW